MAVAPFKPTTTVENIKKYGAMWARGLCYAVQLLTPHPAQTRDNYSLVGEDWWDEAVPGLKGNDDQRKWVKGVNVTLDKLMELQGEDSESLDNEGGQGLLRQQEMERWQRQLDRVILGLSMSLISHPLELSVREPVIELRRGPCSSHERELDASHARYSLP